LMSGQILFRGLFGEVFSSDDMVTLHTADYSSDVLTANYEHCSLLQHLEDDARNSPEFNEHLKSTQNVMKLWKGQLHANETRIVDCLMTTICTDRTLPDAVNDFDGDENGNSVFAQLVRYVSSFSFSQSLLLIRLSPIAGHMDREPYKPIQRRSIF